MKQYSKEMIDTLVNLGFYSVTHTLWRHWKLGITINVPWDTETKDLPKIIMDIGEANLAGTIRGYLGIK